MGTSINGYLDIITDPSRVPAFMFGIICTLPKRYDADHDAAIELINQRLNEFVAAHARAADIIMLDIYAYTTANPSWIAANGYDLSAEGQARVGLLLADVIKANT